MSGGLHGVDLFSGIGGLTWAVEPWMRPVAYCEADRFCQSVLLSLIGSGVLPEGPIWNDITTLSGIMLPRILAISAGFPCQDISICGTRNGRKGLDGARSGLFWQLIRITDETRPLILFLENVSEAQKLEPTIRGAFKRLGYEIESTTSTVYSVGGSHKRERWFAIAYDPSIGIQGMRTIAQQESYALCIPQLPLCTSDGQWEIEPDFRRAVHELPYRMDSIKALGNAVYARQARQAYSDLFRRLTA